MATLIIKREALNILSRLCCWFFSVPLVHRLNDHVLKEKVKNNSDYTTANYPFKFPRDIFIDFCIWRLYEERVFHLRIVMYNFDFLSVSEISKVDYRQNKENVLENYENSRWINFGMRTLKKKEKNVTWTWELKMLENYLLDSCEKQPENVNSSDANEEWNQAVYTANKRCKLKKS